MEDFSWGGLLLALLIWAAGYATGHARGYLEACKEWFEDDESGLGASE